MEDFNRFFYRWIECFGICYLISYDCINRSFYLFTFFFYVNKGLVKNFVRFDVVIKMLFVVF